MIEYASNIHLTEINLVSSQKLFLDAKDLLEFIKCGNKAPRDKKFPQKTIS